MLDDLPLSQHLRSYVEFLDQDGKRDVPADEREEAQKAERIVQFIVGDIIQSRESVVENLPSGIEKFMLANPELVRHFLGERLTRDVIDAIPAYVSRTMELSRLEGSRTPSRITNRYVREAVRTYIFGFSQASIALSRAAMEQAPKEELGHQGRKIFVDMNGLLDEAEGGNVIDGVIRKIARKIASDADLVLHEEPADAARAYEVLLMLRGVLQHIYAV
ncbi:MAG: hypothetical protein ABSA32_15125 [Candidatus Acidiferrales bacterium]|jgi:hypothetical protein